MNLNVLNVVLFGTGAVLLYSAIKNKQPLDVVKQSLGQVKTTRPITEPQPTQPTSSGTGVVVTSV